MSYKYRKEKRITAHRILSILCDHYEKQIRILQDPDEDYLDLFKVIPRPKILELFSIVEMLSNNGHIEKDLDTPERPRIKITNPGVDAFRESYYLKENQKDRLESIELYTKWIIPIGSFIISIIALLFSILRK
ncbi:hypothetical protein [Puia dinghuensis]|uniref:Uncharacterized protein n=1 Tax=Puia dinghuensis TaxID=1792502 RepID=A0A8J2XSB3_9BACT|nr:hypothetical protein [Puia dinghuensis]GGA93718.1 hypothetical protein GCM10011511_16260 [Puia dinghuensis]